MITRYCLMILMLCSVLAAPATGQPAHRDRRQHPPVFGDAARDAYRDAYALILNERWREARKGFQKLTATYPSSEYVEDATYWSTYSLARIDRQKGIRAYASFLRSFPDGRYSSDAFADMIGLQTEDALRSGTPAESLSAVTSPQSFFRKLPGLRVLRQNLLRMKKELRLRPPQFSHASVPVIAPFPVKAAPPIDAETRLKIEYLRSLKGAPDKEELRTIRIVVLDTRQAEALRAAALQELIKGPDPLPILFRIARSDTNSTLGSMAILSTRNLRGSRHRSFDSLTTLYRTLPPSSVEQRSCILDAVADIGGGQAEAFLERVARSSGDTDLRLSAIENLSQASGRPDGTLSFLIDLFRDLPDRETAARQSILYAAADIGSDRAVDFLVKVARSKTTPDLRDDALYLLGNIGGEKARNAFPGFYPGDSLSLHHPAAPRNIPPRNSFKYYRFIRFSPTTKSPTLRSNPMSAVHTSRLPGNMEDEELIRKFTRGGYARF